MIQSVVKSVKEQGFHNIIVVDDGSSDETADKARQAGAMIVCHKINRGKGGATCTGLVAAKQVNADIVVTMDGDGQHDPRDITKIIKPLLIKKTDVVLGSRLHTDNRIPRGRVLVNRLANIMTWLLYGLAVTDSQSGFRAYSRLALEKINPTGSRYEYDSEVIREIALHKLRYQEIPIRVQYTLYSQQKPHRQNLANGLKTVYKLIWNVVS